MRWPYAWVAAALGSFSAIAVFALAYRPVIEVFESHLKIGGRAIPWTQIRRVDRSASLPLVVYLTLADKSRVMVLYAGIAESNNSLLRHLRRNSREALIDGVPYRQFWGEPSAASSERRQMEPPRYPLLLPNDEAEVERLFQRLKAVGHLDPKSTEEK
jgi:hypothetical protein